MMKKQITETGLNPLVNENIKYNILVESPSQTITPLQMVCFFDFSENQNYQGGTAAVNQHFNGEIDNLRKAGIFKGNFLETLLITPKQAQIPAEKLLLFGLGNPSALSFELLEQVGYYAALEALKLGVESFCFAPSLKDAGILMQPGLEVSTALPRGMAKAISVARTLADKKLGDKVSLKEIFLLAGEAQAAYAYQGLIKAFEVK